MQYPLINVSFLEGFSELLAERGQPVEPLFKQAGLSMRCLHKPDTLIPFDRHNHLLQLAASQLNCPHFSLELARRQGLFVFGPLATMVCECSSIGEALETFNKHISLVVQTVTLSLIPQGELSRFIIRCNFERVGQTVTFQDHAMALAYGLIRIFSGNDWLPRAAYFPHGEPDDIKPYMDFFHCPLGFGHQDLVLVLDTALLDKPLHEEARLLPRRLRNYLEQRHSHDLLDQVKHVIALTLASEECNLDSVGRALGYSARTLQRRLSQAHTSFQALLDQVRHNQATHYLAHPYYRMTDIAAMLGYSELSAFSRSFKRWYGVSPQKWRSAV